VTASNPHFDFEDLLLRAIERAGDKEIESEDDGIDKFESEGDAEPPHSPLAAGLPPTSTPTLSAADR